MRTEGHYTMRYVSRQTGLKPHILRAWERRYAAVVPRRTETNRRLYSESDIYRLQLLKVLVESGHAISHVASLTDDELLDLKEKSTPQSQPLSRKGRRVDAEACDEFVAEALEHVIRLDPVALEKVLERAAVTLSRPDVLHSVIQPLFVQIGELWAAGKLKIINEHMASIVVRSFLSDMLRTIAVGKTSPKIVVAAPVGQWHETGALVAALAAAESGWRPLYFGPNLPAEEIAAATQITAAKAIALSISHRIEITVVVHELRKLRRYCARQVEIFVGGYGISDLKTQADPINVTCIENMENFRSGLESLK